MASKGFNSILFDFTSLIDMEITAINWIRDVFRDSTLENFDKHKLLYTKMDDLKFHRVYGAQDLFQSMITNPNMNKYWMNTLTTIYSQHEKSILSEKYACVTQMPTLISAYKKAGEGIIRTTVRCDNDIQASLAAHLAPDASIEICEPDKVDMSKYGRLICGNYLEAIKYILNEPKSILILNFRENFTENDITKLRPELIISLGDIHDIQVISAFPEKESTEEPKG